MLKNLLRHKLRIVLVALLILVLALVRMYEDQLFYDPMLSYFKSNFLLSPLPEIDQVRMFFNLAMRYFFNTIPSLLIIYTVFKKAELVKFAQLLYVMFFVILIMSFLLVYNYFPESKMTLFYLRRFLIQPLFLLLFIPAFYFQERSFKK